MPFLFSLERNLTCGMLGVTWHAALGCPPSQRRSLICWRQLQKKHLMSAQFWRFREAFVASMFISHMSATQHKVLYKAHMDGCCSSVEGSQTLGKVWMPFEMFPCNPSGNFG